MHWSSKYIGRPYVHGDSDCARLLSDVRVEVFGLPVPSIVDLGREKTALLRANQIDQLVHEFGEQTQSPKDGDAVLMICAGRPSHVGVYCVINYEPCVLHAMQSAGMVVLHKIRDLDKYFLKVEGYYSWK